MGEEGGEGAKLDEVVKGGEMENNLLFSSQTFFSCQTIESKCADRSMEVEIFAFFEEIVTDRPTTYRPTIQQTDMMCSWGSYTSNMQ